MLPFDDCILGNSALHARFLATTEILARLVSSAPRKVHLTQLEDDTGRCAAEITACCAALGRAGLLTVHDGHEPAWSLAGTPALVTLEDVFCCVMNEQMPRARNAARREANARADSDVNLFLMQAMIAVNQSVLKHLRQFSLDRLKISAAGMFPAPRRKLGDDRTSNAFELSISGREASYGSSVRVSA